MRLARLGSFHQTRLSFLRALLRRMQRERWIVDRPRWEIDDEGYGCAVYAARGPVRTYSLVCFSTPLAPEKRMDRVLAEAWDTSYVLYDGVPDESAIARLRANVPRQEAGRFLASELVLSRANRSVRLFDAVVASLAEGRQPDAEAIEDVGYLMRTTAVYGNGKFGVADREVLVDRPEMSGPYRAEMLTVWLIRAFTVDLVEHIARASAPRRAVALEPPLRRRLGIGNATGLGMAPFLVKHMTLIGRWVEARETALARVRALPRTDAATAARFVRLVARARASLGRWITQDPVQAPRVVALGEDLRRLAVHVATGALDGPRPWDRLHRWGEDNLGLEGQEYLVTLMLEPHGSLVDDLAETMAVDEDATFRIDGTMTCGRLRELIAEHYAWALAVDYGREAEQARFWYTSIAKLEPRIGFRFEEPGAERELPLGIGRDVADLHRALHGAPATDRVADVLVRLPEHRHAVRRIQAAPLQPYGEIRDNLLGAGLRPIDILRAKLSFFGVTRFDPRSDLFLRITLFQGAPFPPELADAPDEWIYGEAA
jgi:hypothetical protein